MLSITQQPPLSQPKPSQEFLGGAGDAVPCHGKGRLPGPSTTQELVLYAKEHGAELILARGLTGPEKLRIRAETLSGAVQAPFNLDELFKLAESQLDQHLAIIDQLQDNRFFYEDIIYYLNSRSDFQGKNIGKKKQTDYALVAHAIAQRIHNLYYVAASWKQALLLLQELRTLIPDFDASKLSTIYLKQNQTFCDRFVLLYRLFVVLVGVNQKNVALAAAASQHYAHYFFPVQSAWMAFKREEAMGAMKFLIDTVVMELIFPESEYPLHILFAILAETLETSPKENKRFSQRLFDAIGDLSDAVKACDMLESTLVGPWEKLRDTIPPYTDAFEAYIDAEYFSIRASQEMGRIQQLLNPLTKTKDKGTLNRLWKDVNQVYIEIGGYDIDKTWQLTNDRNPTPKWQHIFPTLYFDDSASKFSDIEEEANKAALALHKDRKKIKTGERGLGRGGDPKKKGHAAVEDHGGALVKKGKGGNDGSKKPVRKITAGEKGDASGDDSDELPGLAFVSGSSGRLHAIQWLPSGAEKCDLAEEEDESSEEGDDLYDSDLESGYDTEEVTELSKLFLQMLKDSGKEDVSSLFEDSDGDDEGGKPAGGKSSDGPPRPPGMEYPNKKENKPAKNPFKRLMQQFAGRLFSVNETLSSEQPRRPDPAAVEEAERVAKARPPPKPQTVAKATPAVKQATNASGFRIARVLESDSDEVPALEPIGWYDRMKPTEQTKTSKPTIEEVKDEEEKMSRSKRRRQRKKGAKEEALKSPTMPAVTPVTPTPSASDSAEKGAAKANGTGTLSPTPSASTIADYHSAWFWSTASLHQPSTQAAQSARSYLASSSSLKKKKKTKTRTAGPPTTIEVTREPPTKEKFTSKITELFKGKEKEPKSEKEKEKSKLELEIEPFAVPEKVSSAMRTLFGAEKDRMKSMKWEVFIKAMQGMGFTYDQSTAGSSVKFDPPDRRDSSITFHKPHPDPTLQGVTLLAFMRRLHKQYGWTAEHFAKFEVQANAV
ncbi:hypothetical protein FRC04_006582 [Tulasnella sp. 424]|nr:hypothetical protein FRC04_006582 [Tulasnella sp. 424]